MPENQLEDQAIFEVARNIDSPAARETYIHQMCGEDLGLEQRVKALLQAFEESESFLESPPSELELAATRLEPVSEQVGTQIGPFKLLQQIGEGGMGVVYMAEQTVPVERRVALKVIKPGMDTRTVIARFEAERQALAMMDHPNIAKVLDAGTTKSGHPYFVMELVKGVPITQYCDDHQLTPRQRLELFMPVCQAVQHAHQKGIIHRDLKPSNVLVTEYDDRPVPKVIDFGVAKAIQQRLTDKTMFTELGQVIGTLDYMSPEQTKLNQLDIDTRSDIYSLGVMLYELLTGNPPFDRVRLRSAAIDEVMRIIREEEPPRPSIRLSSVDTLPSVAANRHIDPRDLTRQLRGEIDWIVMKTLEKDRTRRYDTANGLAADIKRFLDDDPVLACPPSKAYLFRKFAKRNKSVMTTAAILTAAILLGSGISVWQAVRASHEARRANAAERLAQLRYTQETQSRLQAEQSQQDAEQARQHAESQQRIAERMEASASENLDLALSALDDIYLTAVGEERLLAAASVDKANPSHLADLHGGFSEKERDLLQRGLQFYQRLAGSNSKSESALRRTAQANYRVALLHSGLGQIEQARPAFRAAIRSFESLTSNDSPDVSDWSELAKSRAGLAATLDGLNQGTEIHSRRQLWKTARRQFN